jgi:hypothetical protein
VSLAGVPLLRKTAAGFAPRPASEIAALLKAAYGEDPTNLQSRLGALAQALNAGDFAKAMIAAVHTRTPELSQKAALKLAKADGELAKHNYNPDEPRDWHGRWTKDGSAGPESTAALRIASDRGTGASASNQRQYVAENASPTGIDATAPSNSGDSNAAGGPASLEETLEIKYDDLGPVDFAKEVIQFGLWLERAGGSLSLAEKEHALKEYSFLQDRLSLWLGYDYKPPTAHGPLLSAALTLYQGAINGGIVPVGHLPESMVDVLGTAALFTDGPPKRPSTESAFEEAPSTFLHVPKEIEGIGGTVSNSRVKIVWRKGIRDQGDGFEVYYGEENPDAKRLPPGSTGFDYFKDVTGEAISNKTLDTLTASRIKRPQKIYEKMTDYVDDIVNYSPSKESDLDPSEIQSKTIHLAIPEWTSPTQWQYLLRGIVYGKDNGVSIVITRISE